ncbi:MAG TPA: hypothetical protein VFI08_05230 [Spirochaetia bacterium]|nr:hypothetical protein [Spirochaetia bacterium]
MTCDLLGGEFTRNIETQAAGFFAEDGLPPLSRTRNTLSQVRMCFRHLRSAQEELEFD